eukprot:3016290-Pyramimonas_sp.AAC.1
MNHLVELTRGGEQAHRVTPPAWGRSGRTTPTPPSSAARSRFTCSNENNKHSIHKWANTCVKHI